MHPVHTFPAHFPKNHSDVILRCMPMSSPWSLPFRFSIKNFPISHVSLARYLPHPSHLSRFGHPDKVWCITEVTKLLIMPLSLASCLFFPLTSKYSPQDPVLSTPAVCVLPLVWEIKFHTHTKKGQNHSFVCFNLLRNSFKAVKLKKTGDEMKGFE